MNNSLRKTANECEPLGIYDFLQMPFIEIAEAMADGFEHFEGKLRRVLEKHPHFIARQKINDSIFRSDRSCRTWPQFEDGHFAKDFAGTKLGENMPGIGAGHEMDDFDATIFN